MRQRVKTSQNPCKNVAAANKKRTTTIAVGNGQFMQGDCLDGMKTIQEESITLAFTSPPYHNAVNYNQHIKKLKGEINFWQREHLSYDVYRQFLIERFRELFRLIRPGGHNIVNIAPVRWKERRVALPFHFVAWMEEIGWQFKEDIIWEKQVVRDKRSGVLMQHPYPGYYYPSLSAEYVLVFQKAAATKNKSNIYHNRTEEEKRENKIDLANYQAMSKNVWTIRPVAPQENTHPCPFPEELAQRVIEFYSYKKDTVIDIFCGSGTTNYVAEKFGRKHIGLETEKEYINQAINKINNMRGFFDE